MPSKKILRLSLFWMALGFSLLVLGVHFAMESFSLSKALLAQASIIGETKLIWLLFLAKLISPELAILGSLLVWMALGFLITRLFWMQCAKALVLLLMHKKPHRLFFLALLIAPIAIGVLTVLVPWVDCTYALGVSLGLSFFNGGFIFLKFSQALKMHLRTR